MEFYQEETNKLRRMIVWLVDIIVVISLAVCSVWVWNPDPNHGTVHDAGAKKRRRGVDEPFIL